MQPFALIVYGLPGSGKSTQAALLADALGMYFFDTGQIVWQAISDPANADKPAYRRELENYRAGRLMTPEFVVEQVTGKLKRLHRLGANLVLSGLPRDLGQAESVLPHMADLYGARRILSFFLDVPDAVAMERNVKRKRCRTCSRTLLAQYVAFPRTKTCPVCGGELYRRPDDTAAVFRTRLKEYYERTHPVLAYSASVGLEVFTVDGAPDPGDIFANIHDYLKKLR